MCRSKPNRKHRRISLFVKFAMGIVLVGIVPIALLTWMMESRMISEYRTSLQSTCDEALRYSAYSVQARLDTYNNLSKFCYYYNYSSDGNFDYNYDNYDNLRKILTGEAFAGEADVPQHIEREMNLFLHYLVKVDANIEAVHFLYAPEGQTPVLYHRGNYFNSLFDDELFLQQIHADSLDTTSRDMLIFPTHDFDYVRFKTQGTEKVITIGRNYYDLTYAVGQERYIGTLFIDLKPEEFNRSLSNLNLSGGGTVYVTDNAGNCCFSSDTAQLGSNFSDVEGEEGVQGDEILLSQRVPHYALTVWCRQSSTPVEGQIRALQRILYLFIGLSLVALLAGSMLFSRYFTQPIRTIMSEMARVESGQFKGRIPVTSNDEMGDLTARFNQMTAELETHTNQVYVAKIKQTEAELTALKSQIYPHFLYNTLEIIRMTAMSERDDKVAKMVEALSDQIRYLIGTASDVVPLSAEVDILQKYIFLINCRFDNKVDFKFSCDKLMETEIPKLILQPIVENAFVHGIKPKEGPGSILLQAERVGDDIVLTVLDNGVGMNAEALSDIEALLKSDNPGRKREYQWESIGLKNVHDRLRYLYGPKYGIALFSTLGMGTVVKATVPGNLRAKEEGNNVPDDSCR